jgi:hypothetical protein
VTHFFLAAGGAGGAIAHGLTYVTDQLDDQLHHLHRVDCRLWLAKRWTTLPLDYEQLAMLLGVSYVLLGLLTVVPSENFPPGPHPGPGGCRRRGGVDGAAEEAV